MRDVHCCVTVDYQLIVNSNIANQIHGFTIEYGKFILITIITCALSSLLKPLMIILYTILFHFVRPKSNQMESSFLACSLYFRLSEILIWVNICFCHKKNCYSFAAFANSTVRASCVVYFENFGEFR